MHLIMAVGKWIGKLSLFVWRLLPDMLSIIIASTNAKHGLDTTSSILLLLLVTSISTCAEIWASIPTIVPPCYKERADVSLVRLSMDMCWIFAVHWYKPKPGPYKWTRNWSIEAHFLSKFMPKKHPHLACKICKWIYHLNCLRADF